MARFNVYVPIHETETWKLFTYVQIRPLPHPILLQSNYCTLVMASLETQEEAMQTERQLEQDAPATQTQDKSVGHDLTQEDLERTARDYAQYLVVNCQQEV